MRSDVSRPDAETDGDGFRPRGSPPHTPGVTVWLTGLPSSGKTTLARAVEKRLIDLGRPVEVLDGDVVRTRLTRDLGFSREDRIENVRRIGFVANLLRRNGITVLCPVIAPYRESRDEVRALHEGHFVEVHVDAPVAVCAERDVKGLYARQRAGEIIGLTGVDDPYETPLRPEVVVRTDTQTLGECVDAILRVIT